MAEGSTSAATGSPWESMITRIVGLLVELESLRQQITALNSSIEELVERFDFMGRMSTSSIEELTSLRERGAMEEEAAIDTYNERGRKLLSEVEVSKRLEEMETVRVGSGCRREEEEAEVCAVCMEGLETGCEVKLLACSHKYHRDCIGSWMAYKNLCPLCRCNLY
uniref:RING-type domain-containing protein n=1 Tax=Nymphaea colorata TaxID=210225 RepID=A0A5K1D0S5_9MAGN